MLRTLLLVAGLWSGIAAASDHSVILRTPQRFIGGLPVGTLGSSGVYLGYKLVDGEDFDGPLDLQTLSNPNGKYPFTKNYGSGARSAPGALVYSYDSDPDHVGDQDSNLGVPAGLNIVSQGGSLLTLGAIQATSAQLPYLAGRSILSSMLTSAATAHMTPPFILEALVTFPNGGGPMGWHPDVPWAKTGCPLMGGAANGTSKSIEPNFEGSSTKMLASYTPYNVSGQSSSQTTLTGVYNGQPRLMTIVVAAAQITWLVDGAVQKTQTVDTTQVSDWYWLLTNHTYNATWGTDTGVSASAWAASATGAPLLVDWVRVWIPTTGSILSPVQSLGSLQTPFNTAFTLQLPTLAALWSGNPDSDCVQQLPVDDFAPGRPSFASAFYSNFGSGVSFNSSTRVLSGTVADRPGRLHLIASAQKASGALSGVARGYIDVGPNITATYIFGVVNQAFSWDAYHSGDVGNLLPKKLFTLAGLPSWAAYQAPTSSGLQATGAGYVTGTPTAAGTTQITESVTNSVGQSASATPSIVIGSQVGFPSPVTSGLILELDAQNPGSGVGSSLAQWNDISGSANHCTQATSALQPTVVANIFGSRNGVRFTGSANQYLSCPTAVAQAMDATGGTSTVIAAVLPVSTPAVAARIFQARLSSGAATDTTGISLKNTQIQSTTGNTTTSVTSQNGTAASLTKPTLITASFTGGTTARGTQIRVSGVAQTASGTLAQLDVFDRAIVGIDAAGTTPTFTYPLDAYVCDLLVFSPGLSTAQIQQVEAQLKAYCSTQ